MAKLRLGVIGAGSWTVSSHLPNLERWRDDVEFTIVNRRTPELLEKIKNTFGFQKATTNWEDVIAERCDIVIVGSPVGYHHIQTKPALGVALWLTDLRGQDVFALMSAPLDAKVELHDAISVRYTNGAIGTLGGGSSYRGAGNNRHQVYLRAIGSKGQLMVDLERNVLWRYRSPSDDVNVPLDKDAGLYDCRGPVDAVVLAGLGRPYSNNSPAELGARTVEILDAAYRSAKGGRIERVATLALMTG